MAYIEELGRELEGRNLDIWRGHLEDETPLESAPPDDKGIPRAMPPARQEQYRQLWRRQAATGGASNQEVVRRPTPKRPGCGCHKPG